MGGLSRRGLCPGGLCQGDPPDRDPPHMVTSGRYTSYWNAFLLYLNCSNIDVNQKSSFLRKKSALCGTVLVVTEFVVSGTQCTSLVNLEEIRL